MINKGVIISVSLMSLTDIRVHYRHILFRILANKTRPLGLAAALNEENMNKT